MIDKSSSIFLWKTCDGKTIEEVVKEYKERFKGKKSDADLEKDALDFIQELKEMKLLEEE